MKNRETAAKIAAFVFKFSQIEDDGEPAFIDGQTKSQAINAAQHLKMLADARSKGGKAYKKFASDKERYDFHNAKRKAERRAKLKDT